jgi:apolipoprotein N-acyltransferase
LFSTPERQKDVGLLPPVAGSALASGALVTLALPPFGFGALVWVALVPLLRLRRRVTGAPLFAAAWGAVLLPAASVTRWLGLPGLSAAGFALALAGGPVPFALAAVAATRIEGRLPAPTLAALVWPAAAAAADAVLHLVVAAVPVPVDLMVPSLAWAFSRGDVMVQSLYLVGSTAVVVFVVVAANVGAEAVVAWAERVARTRELRARGLGPAVLAVAVCLADGAAGLWHLARTPAPTASPGAAVSGIPRHGR